ncbi:MAG: TRAP transporter small permease [Synergistaceae bacterium]|nr:TRAP transporter small permease [Synergistaceae bacterium]
MLNRFLKALERGLEEKISMAIMVLISVFMGMQICARYVFNSSLSWPEEVCVYLLMWMGMLSLSYCIRTRTSIKVEMIIDLFSPKIKKTFLIFEDIVAIIFYGFMCIPAWQLLNIAISRGQVSAALLLPMYLIQVSPLVSFALAVMRSFQDIYFRLNDFPPD